VGQFAFCLILTAASATLEDALYFFLFFILTTDSDQMNQGELLNEIISNYRKHGWRLQRVLLRPETRVNISVELEAPLIEDAPVDALWFSRTSHANRVAWELRLLAETPYALFETFAADEPEPLQEESRKEMEVRLREYIWRAGA